MLSKLSIALNININLKSLEHEEKNLFPLKVVAVLQEIVNFIQRGISPQVGLSEFERGEPLKQAVSMTFGQVINKIKGKNHDTGYKTLIAS